ncbi:MaoC family dehydratase N-terminal domain-containing protein [Loktanella sp. R86503]|uniref:FAS1-like dehydratase domain-containing protein n=1 Tax=Loktanella sp. R86503 TaxID=3093847 RepID=UPI0036DC196F
MNTADDRTQTRTDLMDPARAQALQAALGAEPAIVSGDPLPPFAHHIYFWDAAPPSRLGRDGHPATGSGFIPDLGLPRRMWAAGRLMFHQPLLAGVRAERISRIEGITRKDGRSGPLAFVRVRHDIRQRQALALTEWQDLVFRPDGMDQSPAPAARTDEVIAEPFTPDTTLLFRYSALTLNGHRIHYDEAYAREVEGYDGLVVHAPLLAHLLMGLAQRQLGELREFAYRATAPLMHHETAALCWRDGIAWVRTADGRQCMIAEAR